MYVSMNNFVRTCIKLYMFKTSCFPIFFISYEKYTKFINQTWLTILNWPETLIQFHFFTIERFIPFSFFVNDEKQKKQLYCLCLKKTADFGNFVAKNDEK